MENMQVSFNNKQYVKKAAKPKKNKVHCTKWKLRAMKLLQMFHTFE